jgi:hypothetical protein
VGSGIDKVAWASSGQSSRSRDGAGSLVTRHYGNAARRWAAGNADARSAGAELRATPHRAAAHEVGPDAPIGVPISLPGGCIFPAEEMADE